MGRRTFCVYDFLALNKGNGFTTIFSMTDTKATLKNLKEQLSALQDRENRFDTVQKCRKQQLNSPPPTIKSEVTSEHKDLATQWMHEVVIDSKV